MYLCLSYVLFHHKIWKKNHFAKVKEAISQRGQTVKGNGGKRDVFDGLMPLLCMLLNET
jgi:hypothetical protein